MSGESYYSVELYFDPALENQVLKAWNVLARRQISSQLIEMESRPHITLVSSPLLEPSKIQGTLRTFSSKHEPLPLTVSSVSSLASDRDALFFTPTPTLPLLLLHSHLCDTLRRDGLDLPQHFRPDSWLPHCPVAQAVPRNRLSEAFSVLRDLKLPVSGYAMDLALVEYSPARELFAFPLGTLPSDS